MALQLYKLVVASTLTDTQYFQTTGSAITLTSTPTTILATTFFHGSGSAVSSFTTATSNGYYSLMIGGVMQQTGIYTVSGSALTLTVGTVSQTITASSPISLTVTESTVTT